MQLALFDFDHTLTRCDTYGRFLRKVAPPARRASARWTVGPWLLAYRAGLISATSIRARVTRVALQGHDAGELAALAREYAGTDLPDLLRPEMMARIDWHRSEGHRIVVVSGSLDLYLGPWCERHGLEVICNRLEIRDGCVTGRYLDGDIGAYKVREITRRIALASHPCIHAYGDSREDRGMLALAHERWYAGKRIA
ncbi:HAD family hydrolase [Luteimonas sp. SDU82]|uniref:HAD family hydrolase n=1 Tax=Luteimonas sp. SDU82 TaxID=3422592 RepID=UPI003EB80292